MVNEQDLARYKKLILEQADLEHQVLAVRARLVAVNTEIASLDAQLTGRAESHSTANATLDQDESAAESTSERVKALLRGSPERQFSVMDIVQALGISHRPIRGALSRLHTGGEIFKVDRGLYSATPAQDALEGLNG